MRYPYVKYNGRHLPIIPVELKKGEEWIVFDAYIDSGAGYSIFHTDVAAILGIDIETGEESFVVVGDGSKIKVYIHNLKVKLMDKEFEAVIGFSHRLGIGFNILGQESVFDRFRICFDRKEKVVELYPKDIPSKADEEDKDKRRI